MVRVIVCGAQGKMGRKIIDLITGESEVELVGAIEVKGHSSLGSEVGGGVKVSSDLRAVINRGDVVIDFTNPQASLENLAVAVTFKKAMVMGTTGHSEEQKRIIQEKAKTIPILMAPNMSLGINLLYELVESAASVLRRYDVEIVEIHHNEKRDAPSGTARALAERIARVLKAELDEVAVYGRKGMIGPRGKEEIGIHSVRAGDIVGEHTVIFAGMGERLELTHRAHNRDCFARGAIEGAKWICKQPVGLYDMEDLLGLRREHK